MPNPNALVFTALIGVEITYTEAGALCFIDIERRRPPTFTERWLEVSIIPKTTLIAKKLTSRRVCYSSIHYTLCLVCLVVCWLLELSGADTSHALRMVSNYNP